MTARGQITALIGAQYGSEGKGVVARYLADKYDIAVRTGGPNAGHSIAFDGKVHKMQALPCGWVNPRCILIIGPGAIVSPAVLLREIEATSAALGEDIRGRVFVDGAAGILDQHHHDREGGVNGLMHRTMGSTGEGVGAARIDRISREPYVASEQRGVVAGFRLARECGELRSAGIHVIEDTARMIQTANLKGSSVILEGTQGCGLSLVHGSWPHVTSHDTNAAQLAADAGIPPQYVTDTILVARTYPIRVAGPSGPLLNELTWRDMSVRVGREVLEHTTVTQKIRRVGEWDEGLFRKAITLNAPAWIALTFADYVSGADAGKTRWEDLSSETQRFVYYLERTFGIMVRLVGTGFSENGWTCVDRWSGWSTR